MRQLGILICMTGAVIILGGCYYSGSYAHTDYGHPPRHRGHHDTVIYHPTHHGGHYDVARRSGRHGGGHGGGHYGGGHRGGHGGGNGGKHR